MVDCSLRLNFLHVLLYPVGCLRLASFLPFADVMVQFQSTSPWENSIKVILLQCHFNVFEIVSLYFDYCCLQCPHLSSHVFNLIIFVCRFRLSFILVFVAVVCSNCSAGETQVHCRFVFSFFMFCRDNCGRILHGFPYSLCILLSLFFGTC